ncbi:peptide-N4-asparagine amidase [Lentzea aerocolonigenes]|uniref:peptide-N4-asparagine amidase n=1 Tax=Lentzea aerocolonigenes TaxID=68170 RepID=UPI0005EC288F|nr:peptide-N4-asparagine amidase [Lentzea aerocolonigenes]
MRRILATALAVLALLPVPAAMADRVVTDYQDPLQAIPAVSRPPTKSCVVTAMRHTFANSYGQPFVGTLAPPPECAGPWTKVVLDWTGRSKGRQFDRLAGLWIGGAEVLRTSTPEPDPSGIVWHFDRDITAFTPLLTKAQPFVVDLGNVVNDTYTGPFDIEVTVTYYQASPRYPAPRQADVVLPLSADAALPGWQFLKDGKKFSKQLVVPPNTAKLTAEIYARGGGCEEFWWSNVPSDLAAKFPDAGLCGGGTYREVSVLVDGRPAGVVAPYSVIYTGGVAPMLWRPISAIDAIDTLPYTIDLSPFIGTLTDGKAHTIDLVPPRGIVDDWTLGGNLFATTDPGVQRVTGTLSSTDVPAADVKTVTTGTDLDVTIKTQVRRAWRTSGAIRTSHGTQQVFSQGAWTFSNTTSLAEKATKQKTDQKVTGAYSSKGRLDGFDFPLNVDVTQNIVNDNNYRIDASVHMGRRLWTVGDGARFVDDSLDTQGGFGRTDGVLSYADGSSSERWRGTVDGRFHQRTLKTEHGYVVPQ